MHKSSTYLFIVIYHGYVPTSTNIGLPYMTIILYALFHQPSLMIFMSYKFSVIKCTVGHCISFIIFLKGKFLENGLHNRSLSFKYISEYLFIHHQTILRHGTQQLFSQFGTVNLLAIMKMYNYISEVLLSRSTAKYFNCYLVKET